jgi:DNA-binding GntR family transcriptional regulator
MRSFGSAALVETGDNPGSGGAEESGLLRERAYRELKDLLVLSVGAPPAFLSSRKLANQLGMSNTPVRSALERLESDGLVTITPQQGILVNELSAKEILDHYEIREAIEPYVLKKLAGRLTEDQAERLSAQLEEQDRSIAAGDIRRIVVLDSEFHLLLCELLGNEEILRLMVRLRDQIHRVITQIARLLPDRRQASYAEHAAIVDALLCGDAEKAGVLVMEHLENGKRLLMSSGSG